MADQKRMVHAKVLENFDYGIMSAEARLLFIFLVVLADDDGRIKANATALRGRVFAFDDKITTAKVEGFLKEIVAAKLVDYYAVGKEHFIAHPNWTKYQYLRKDLYKASTIPSRDGRVTPPSRQSDAGGTQVSKQERKEASKQDENVIKKIGDELRKSGVLGKAKK